MKQRERGGSAGETNVSSSSRPEGRVLEVVGRLLERVLPRQRQDLLVGGDEVGHPGDGGDDERLPGGVDVGLGPRQHPHARQLREGRERKNNNLWLLDDALSEGNQSTSEVRRRSLRWESRTLRLQRPPP
jgi:hypothetical protein